MNYQKFLALAWLFPVMVGLMFPVPHFGLRQASVVVFMVGVALIIAMPSPIHPANIGLREPESSTSLSRPDAVSGPKPNPPAPNPSQKESE